MGKRSNFERIEKDFYPTPYKAILPLLPHLSKDVWFYEPCCGANDLINHLVLAVGKSLLQKTSKMENKQRETLLRFLPF